MTIELGLLYKPAEVKPLLSLFVIKLKLDADGAFERYKARLVARGDQQVEGVYFQDTFSPVMDMTTTRIIFAFGIIWDIHQGTETYQLLTHEHQLKQNSKSTCIHLKALS